MIIGGGGSEQRRAGGGIVRGLCQSPDEALPDLLSLPPEILQSASPPGTYFDAFPLRLLTTDPLATMRSCAPEYL